MGFGLVSIVSMVGIRALYLVSPSRHPPVGSLSVTLVPVGGFLSDKTQDVVFLTETRMIAVQMGDLVRRLGVGGVLYVPRKDSLVVSVFFGRLVYKLCCSHPLPDIFMLRLPFLIPLLHELLGSMVILTLFDEFLLGSFFAV
ncbi:hypothetical protein Pyn_10338 [Prunus yedoensis var. nudiflora]|uniref:Uncharacterized protein n=1 Tax=Prunus yedoensis var. nudiflora TaxID=2094558 RepID=A0A314YR91_PRUYE|nr:hypothetical protein Pyn_10338 [Prunus yedoensis var. nudiflora]